MRGTGEIPETQSKGALQPQEHNQYRPAPQVSTGNSCRQLQNMYSFLSTKKKSGGRWAGVVGEAEKGLRLPCWTQGLKPRP